MKVYIFTSVTIDNRNLTPQPYVRVFPTKEKAETLYDAEERTLRVCGYDVERDEIGIGFFYERNKVYFSRTRNEKVRLMLQEKTI